MKMYWNTQACGFIKSEMFLVGHIEHSNGFIRVVFVFCVLPMRSIQCRDKAVGCNSQTPIKILKREIIVESYIPNSIV